jgi:hypothetical protein
VNRLSPTSNKPIKSSLRSWERLQPRESVERVDFRAVLRRAVARLDLEDFVGFFEDAPLVRRREVEEAFFFTTRGTPLGAIIARS